MLAAVAIPVLVVLGVAVLWRPEIGIVLCTIAGMILKGIIQPYLGVVDLTVFLYGVTGISILARWVVTRDRIILPPASFSISVALFLAFLIFAHFKSPLPEYSIQILLRFILLNLGVCGFVLMWANTAERLVRLAHAFAGTALLYGTFLFFNVILLPGLLWEVQEFRGVLLGTNPISVGVVLGAGIILALGIQAGSSAAWKRWLLHLLVAINTIQLVATGARGPVLAFGIGCMAWGLILLRRVNWRMVLPAAATVLTSGIAAFALLPEHLLFRFAPSVSLNPEADSVAARLSGSAFVAERFGEWWFAGAGLFGFAYAFTGKTEGLSLYGVYPHNLILDAFSSVGLFGTIVFLFVLGVPLFLGLKALTRTHGVLLFILASSIGAYVAFLVESNFSMGLISTRQLFFFAGMVLALAKQSHVRLMRTEGASRSA